MAPVGFIQDELDLKLLVLYIMSKAAGPITFHQLLELALCDAGVDYFSLTQAVDHMAATGQLSLEDGRYSITDRGRRNSEICENSLPFSVRKRCDENLVKVNDALRREAQVQTSLSPHPDGTATLRLTLHDRTTPLLHLELLAPTPEQGERWAGAFRAGPEELYLLITKHLEEGGDFHETK